MLLWMAWLRYLTQDIGKISTKHHLVVQLWTHSLTLHIIANMPEKVEFFEML
jgi:hypothetical protein